MRTAQPVRLLERTAPRTEIIASLSVESDSRGHSVDVGDDNFQAVTLKEVLRGVIDAVPQIMNRAPRRAALAVAGAPAEQVV